MINPEVADKILNHLLDEYTTGACFEVSVRINEPWDVVNDTMYQMIKQSPDIVTRWGGQDGYAAIVILQEQLPYARLFRAAGGYTAKYQAQREGKALDRQEKESSIRANMWNLWLAIAALAISILSLILQFFL